MSAGNDDVQDKVRLRYTLTLNLCFLYTYNCRYHMFADTLVEWISPCVNTVVLLVSMYHSMSRNVSQLLLHVKMHTCIHVDGDVSRCIKESGAAGIGLNSGVARCGSFVHKGQHRQCPLVPR